MLLQTLTSYMSIMDSVSTTAVGLNFVDTWKLTFYFNGGILLSPLRQNVLHISLMM